MLYEFGYKCWVQVCVYVFDFFAYKILGYKNLFEK